MSSQPEESSHPVVELVDRLKIRLDKLVDQPLFTLTPQEQKHALATLAHDEARLAALKLRLLAHVEETGATLDASAGSAADLLAVQARQVRREARSGLRLAQKLESFDLLAAGMASGGVNPAQAKAIVASLERLPRTGGFAVSPEQGHAAEAHLVGLAAEHDVARAVGSLLAAKPRPNSIPRWADPGGR